MDTAAALDGQRDKLITVVDEWSRLACSLLGDLALDEETRIQRFAGDIRRTLMDLDLVVIESRTTLAEIASHVERVIVVYSVAVSILRP